MGRHELDSAKQAITRVLEKAGDPVPAPQFLNEVVAVGHSLDDVIAAVRQMLDSDEVRFDADMHLRLARQLA